MTKDNARHNLLQRPRDVPVRTSLGVMAIAFYVVLLVSSANDWFAFYFDVSLNATTWMGRIGLLMLPPIAYWVTYRVCLGLQRSDRAMLEHGIETGIIKRLPHGEFIEVHQPLAGVDDHGHAIPLEYQGASVPRKMNQLGIGGAPVPGSLLTPDPPEETAELTRARHELASAEAAHSDSDAFKRRGDRRPSPGGHLRPHPRDRRLDRSSRSAPRSPIVRPGGRSHEREAPVRVDTMMQGTSIAELADEARDREKAGYDGLWTFETAHDPFVQLMPVAEHSERLAVGTAIAVAFARSPMTMAYTANDLQNHSRGRLLLGLGSQVKPHIERRFNMPWSSPAPRMREYISALRAIWASWNSGERLNFRGDFYSHTLMTPFFSPGPNPWGPPRVYLAAVGEHMTRVAGEVCDGLIPHPLTTQRYLRERTLPLLEEGLAASGRTLDGFSISLQGLVVTGRTEEEMAAADLGVRRQIAFYGSTPAYHGVLELHGWGELGVELNRLSRSTDEDRWVRMGELIDDDVLAAFAVVAEPDALGPALVARFGDIVDRFTFYTPYEIDEALLAPAIEALRSA